MKGESSQQRCPQFCAIKRPMEPYQTAGVMLATCGQREKAFLLWREAKAVDDRLILHSLFSFAHEP
jgi:hypothetical protein